MPPCPAPTQDWFRIENEADVPSPAVLLYPDRVEQNLRRLVSLAGDANRLRPHVKTHKLPQIVRMKLDAGIRKFKTATISEAEMTAAAGGPDVLLAIQPVGPNVGRLLTLIERFPATRFSTIVDDASAARAIAAAAAARGISVPLLVDLDVGMGRTGIPVDAAPELYRVIAETPGVEPAGLHAYDGHLHDADEPRLRASAAEAIAPVLRLRDELRREGLSVAGIVAGGTPTSKFLAEHPEVELGAGTPVLWDAGQGEISPDLDFLNAAAVMCRVISRPRPDRLCVDLGHKAVASEMPQPRVRLFGLEDAPAVMHSEEHLVLETAAADYRVGDVIYALPRHVCPTVALHSEVWCVRDRRAVELWPVIARARRLTV